MQTALIGYTGFVGSNLDKQFRFDHKYNSSNIRDIRGREFDLAVCAGIRAEKWLANRDPGQDMNQINNLLENLRKVKAGKFVHISTVDVYEQPVEVDELTEINPEGGHPYGRNRFRAELMLRDVFNDALIIRLPALFGDGLKKNFIFDLLNPVPRVIMPDKFTEISGKMGPGDRELFESCYERIGHYGLKPGLTREILEQLLKIMDKAGFTSLSFTHRESAFQYYTLADLWKDISLAIHNQISLLNLVTEPLPSYILASEIFNLDFTNTTTNPPVRYNIKTVHHRLWNRDDGYIYSRPEVLARLKNYCKNYRG